MWLGFGRRCNPYEAEVGMRYSVKPIKDDEISRFTLFFGYLGTRRSFRMYGERRTAARTGSDFKEESMSHVEFVINYPWLPWLQKLNVENKTRAFLTLEPS